MDDIDFRIIQSNCDYIGRNWIIGADFPPYCFCFGGVIPCCRKNCDKVLDYLNDELQGRIK